MYVMMEVVKFAIISHWNTNSIYGTKTKRTTMS